MGNISCSWAWGAEGACGGQQGFSCTWQRGREGGRAVACRTFRRVREGARAGLTEYAVGLVHNEKWPAGGVL